MQLLVTPLVLLIEDRAAVRVIIAVGEIAAGSSYVCIVVFVLFIVD